MSDYEQWGKGTQARIICDSVNPHGNRITTFVLKYPRMVHAELMTHRMFSRNSSSSRAIPTHKLIQRVIDDPAMPAWWGKNQPGMQAREELDDETKQLAIDRWLEARAKAAEQARILLDLGAHKQIVNRVIEPWMHITVICTSTNYSNWFRLRDHADAQPEIAVLARLMREAYEDPLVSDPNLLEPGEWHLPFITDQDWDEAEVISGKHLAAETVRKVSVARCARVSYLTHDKRRDLSDDLKLHEKLISGDPPHASAFEHAAMALASPEKVGNFVGWLQYRKLVNREAVHCA